MPRLQMEFILSIPCRLPLVEGTKMLLPPRVFRVRVLMQARDNIRIHAFHAGTLYALVAAAASRGRQTPPGIPDGLLLDAPEQCRSVFEPGDRYAFGFTLLAHPDQAR